MVNNHTAFIAGEFEDATSTDAFEVVNPANEQVITTVPAGTVEQADRAVRAASEAFDAWSVLPRSERIDLMGRLGAGLAARCGAGLGGGLSGCASGGTTIGAGFAGATTSIAIGGTTGGTTGGSTAFVPNRLTSTAANAPCASAESVQTVALAVLHRRATAASGARPAGQGAFLWSALMRAPPNPRGRPIRAGALLRASFVDEAASKAARRPIARPSRARRTTI